jgi:tRNA A-37 threonylcarbamoyl transferase component Bud32
MDLSGRCVGSSYVLQRPIGQGATGTVWEALDRTSGESVAVKLLHESLLRQPKLVTRFVQERTILRMLRHRNVVRVRDLFSVGETLGLVMDLVSGGTLRDLLRAEHTVAPGEAARLTAQVAAALAEAHELGVIHRDLKPDNILLEVADGPAETRLTDFGVARILNTPSMTTPSAVFGTPHYMSPEAFHGATASPAGDVYALGVLLYELVSGHPPYRGETIPDLMRQHLAGDPERRPGIPDPLWDLIRQCMEQKPRLRPSAAELVADLTDLAHALAGVPALPSAEVPQEDFKSGKIGLALSGAVGGLPGDMLGNRGAGRGERDDRRGERDHRPNERGDARGDRGDAHDRPADRGDKPDNSKRADGEPVAGPKSVIPQPRLAERRNDVPRWRWARPGATLAMVAGAMAVSAVITTAWNIRRGDGESRDVAVPRIVTAPAVTQRSQQQQQQQQQVPQRHAQARTDTRPAAATAPTRAGTPPRVRPGVAAVVVPPAPSAVRKKPVTTKPEPARSPQPEAKPYGPWNCSQSFAIDFRNRTGVGVKPCQMLGRDIQYQASLTAPGGGGRGSMTVSLQEAGTGRTVGGPRTCENLTFEGEVATRACGPSGAKPTRGRSYTVVVTYRYERDGRTLANTAKGHAFEW